MDSVRQIELQFRPTSRPRRPAVAWFLRGEDPAAWLDALARRSVPMSEWTLLPIPVGRDDLRPCGVLALSEDTGAKASGEPEVETSQCPAYGVVGKRLYLPVEAELNVDVSDDEMSELLGPHLYVFHPTRGLIAFEPQERLRVADLFSVPQVASGGWDAAEPGVALNSRLFSVRPFETPQWEDVVREGRGDIGSTANDVSSLPPAPDEPSDGMAARVGRGIMRGVAGAVGRFIGSSSGTAGVAGGGLFRGLGQWVDGTLQRLDRAAENLRNKEINRLLDMLKRNPDEGLRYAIGVGGGEQHRGVAPPSSRLNRRNVDFSLRRLRGGGPADFWDVPLDIQGRLCAEYRRLADRELALGRYRRAAYIYAELLGDLRAAASALKTGRLWREAAVLYRDRLRAPKEAATCLEEGGLVCEAIALYEELGEWTKVGDLHRGLEQHEEAESAYRKAVDEAVFRGDRVGAADLLETKLGRVDEAIDHLVAGWERTRQARQAFVALFALYARHGRHEEARARIAMLRKNDMFLGRARLIELFCDIPSKYPDAGVGRDAADAARVLAAKHLPQAPATEISQVTVAIRKLVPSDRLLGRDCRRFARRTRDDAPLVPDKPSQRGRGLVLLGEFKLGDDVTWLTAEPLDDSTLVAVGYGELKPDRRPKIVLGRAGCDGSMQFGAFDWSGAVPPPSALMLGRSTANDKIRLKLPGNNWTYVAGLGATDAFPYEIVFRWPNWLPDPPLGAADGPNGSTFTLAEGEGSGELVLWTHDKRGAVLSSRSLPSDAPWLGELSRRGTHFVPMVFRRNRVHFAAGSWLVSALPGGGFGEMETRDEIVGLSATYLHQRPRIAVSFREGAAVFWDQYDGAHLRPLDDDLREPVTRFLRSGKVVVADRKQCQLYDTSNCQIKRIGTLDSLPGEPCAILPAGEASRFAILFTDGTVWILH